MKSLVHTNHRQSAGVIFLLIVAFAAQVLLPIQSHTSTVVTKSGKVVVLCTLQGMQAFLFNDEGGVGEAISDSVVATVSDASNKGSAAFRFSLLLAYSSASLPEFYLAPFKAIAVDFNETILPIFSQDVVEYFSIRAPPLLT